jgi:branched-chain amino acid transport system ATP-binding protein
MDAAATSGIEPPPSTGGITLDAVTAGYPGGPDVLHEVSLSVRTGELVVVLGRNGAGKTTLLRTVSGLIPCRSGQIRLGDTKLSGDRPHRIAKRGVAHVPEGRRLIPGMSVVDNLRLGAFALAGRGEVDTVMAQVLELFPDMAARLRQRAGTLSGGQQQMVAIARALMCQPEVLLLDEPLTGLAPIIQEDVMALLARLRGQQRTILLVEQNAERSLAVADRGVVLAEGRVSLEGEAARMAADDRVIEGYLGIRPDRDHQHQVQEKQ